MKICFIGDASGYHVARWIRYFGQTEHEIHCISTGSASIPGVTIHCIKNPFKWNLLRHFYYPYYLFSARSIIRKIKPDVTHGLQINLFSYFISLLGLHPFVITPFGGDVLVNPSKSRFAKHMATRCLSHSDLITTDADHIQDTLVSLGADASKIQIVFFATDVKQFSPTPKDELLVETLGIHNCPCVLSLRHLMPIYNIETLIRSIPLVRDKIPAIKYLIVSRGPEEEMLKNLADALGVSDCIRWLGFLSSAELAKYINLGDVYVSTSLSDAGLAASTGESMACGLPAVITDFGDNHQWVKDGVNGYLFPMKDSVALAERIISLIKDPQLMETIGRTNREVIVTRYNWATEMQRMKLLYEQVVATGKGEA